MPNIKCNRVAKHGSNPLEPGSDVGIRSKPRIPGRGLPQIKPADLGEAVGSDKVGFRLGSGERFLVASRHDVPLDA